jgi:hypothetical protein
MANAIPLSGLTDAAGGYVLPFDQGEILTNGILQEAGAISLAGDSRATSTRKEVFSIWKGAPTAGFVGEGGTKLATGAEFGAGTLNVKKVATIVLFTDEMIEDVQAGDLNVLVDSGVRTAINDVTDAHAIGVDSGVPITSVFDEWLNHTTNTVEYDQTKPDGLQRAISAAMGKLEAAGYGDPGQMGVLLGMGFAQALRDARSTADSSMPIYGPGTGRDPLYGLASFSSTNLASATTAPGATVALGYVVHRPNLHVRVRKDVTVTTSTEATVNDGSADRKLFQEDLTAVRYETRLGFLIHDINNAVIKIANAT